MTWADRGWLAVDVFAVFLAAHLVFYVFTGLALWSPMNGDELLRPLISAFMHIATWMAFIARRV